MKRIALASGGHRGRRHHGRAGDDAAPAGGWLGMGPGKLDDPVADSESTTNRHPQYRSISADWHLWSAMKIDTCLQAAEALLRSSAGILLTRDADDTVVSASYREG